jgi:hypothetical protein
MAKQIKLDLHTHPFDSLKKQYNLRGIRDIRKEVIATLVKSIKDAGLNGIAITERNDFNYGLIACFEIIEQFANNKLIILPGTEIEQAGQHFVQIYVPDYYRRRIPFFKGKEWFLILAHPGHYNSLDISTLEKVKFDAVEHQSKLGEFSLAGEIMDNRQIPSLAVSDAVKLEELGLHSMTLEFL